MRSVSAPSLDTRAGAVGPSSRSTPSRNRRMAAGLGSPATTATYSLSTPKLGWVSCWARSPSLVITSRPSVAASSRPTGNTRGSVGHQFDHGRAPLRVRCRRDHAGRLVEQVVDQSGPHRYRYPVDRHPVGVGVDPATQHRHFAVDRDPPVGDHFLGRPGGCPSRCGPTPSAAAPLARLAAGIDWPVGRPSPVTRSGPCPPAEPGFRCWLSWPESSPWQQRRCRRGVGDRLERIHDFRPGHEAGQRRQIVDGIDAEPLEEQPAVVPYSTAWPGPGSRATSAT